MSFLISLYFAAVVWADVPTVQFQQFQVGQNWQWTYSSLEDGQWTPYLVEKYTVAEIHRKTLTIEMSSSEFPGSETPAHHKFLINFSKCEAAAKDPSRRHFTVEFYTKSFGPNWTLVSKNHPNNVFTEKFSCWGAMANESVAFDEMLDKKVVYQVQRHPQRETSWYFWNNGELNGVSAGKLFYPRKQYKMEFYQSRSSIMNNR